MMVDVEPEKVVEKSTDDRGRMYLGTEYANKSVKVLILEDE